MTGVALEVDMNLVNYDAHVSDDKGIDINDNDPDAQLTLTLTLTLALTLTLIGRRQHKL